MREGVEKSMLLVERFHPTPLPLRTVYILTHNDRQDIGIERLPIVVAFRLVCECLLPVLGHQRTDFRTLTAISRDVPVLLAERPTSPFLSDMLADRIDGDLPGEAPAGNDAAAGQAVSRSVADG